MPAEVTARPAPLAVRHFESVWGTVVAIDVRDQAVLGTSESVIAAAIAEAVHWLHRVDQIFSTYRPESIVSAYRKSPESDVFLQDFSPEDTAEFLSVREQVGLARTTTDGCFDPWAVPGGFDPSGYVKGWAVQRAAEVLSRHGLHFFAIDGSGDIVCRGGEEVGVPWHIGIRHPEQADAVIKTVRIFDGATATSGTYERGDHIVNPHDFAAGVVGRAATVVGPDAAMCEVMATVAVVQGVPALHRVAALGEQWSGLVVVGEKVTSVGLQFAH